MKLKINSNKTQSNHINMWRPNTTLLNEEWVIEEVRDDIKKFLEINVKGDTTYQNFWDTLKAVLREKFITESLHKKNKKSPNK